MLVFGLQKGSQIDKLLVLLPINKELKMHLINVILKTFILVDKKDQWRITNVQLADLMKKYSVGALNKFLPEWVWQLNKEQCRILLGAMNYVMVILTHF